MKQNWEIKKLGEVCEFTRGLTYSKNDEVEYSDNVVLRSNNIDLDTNSLNFNELKYIKDDIVIPNDKKIENDTLIICTANGSKAHLGKVALVDVDEKYAFGGFMGKLKPIKSLLAKFLFYSMISPDYKKFISKLSDGANINNLKFKDLGLFELPLPPLSDQHRIVSILDEKFSQIETLKSNVQKNLDNAEQLWKAQLEKQFDNQKWEKKKLGDVAKKMIAGGDAPKDDYSKEKTEVYNIPIYANAVADNGLYGYTNKAIINEPSISIAARGSGTGTVFLRNDSYFPIVRLIVVIPNTSITLHKYIYYAVGNIKIEHSGSAIPQLTIPMIKNYEIPIPPLAEQERIVKELDALSAKINTLKANYRRQIECCDELRQSLLKKAFEGEL